VCVAERFTRRPKTGVLAACIFVRPAFYGGAGEKFQANPIAECGLKSGQGEREKGRRGERDCFVKRLPVTLSFSLPV